MKKSGNRASGRGKTTRAAATQAGHRPPDRQAMVRIVNGPTQTATYDLEALVAGITEENRHQAVETGPPVGQEVW